MHLFFWYPFATTCNPVRRTYMGLTNNKENKFQFLLQISSFKDITLFDVTNFMFFSLLAIDLGYKISWIWKPSFIKVWRQTPSSYTSCSLRLTMIHTNCVDQVVKKFARVAYQSPTVSRWLRYSNKRDQMGYQMRRPWSFLQHFSRRSRILAFSFSTLSPGSYRLRISCVVRHLNPWRCEVEFEDLCEGLDFQWNSHGFIPTHHPDFWSFIWIEELNIRPCLT